MAPLKYDYTFVIIVSIWEMLFLFGLGHSSTFFVDGNVNI